MSTKRTTEKYVAFLRGINVGGHHKVPMADLRGTLEKLDCKNVETLLNSGNVIFDAIAEDIKSLENTIEKKLEQSFGFPVPVIVRKANVIHELFDAAPFQDVEITEDIRLYVSFLKHSQQSGFDMPGTSSDDGYKIIGIRDNAILGILDLSVTRTPKAMEALARVYGKDITTRNWKTIERIVKKL